MKDRQADFIDVADLRPGVYVYLDVGWMGHPFALNSFRINTAEQIDTIRGLGIERIRYSPEQTISEEEFERMLAGAAPPQAQVAVAGVGAGGTAAATGAKMAVDVAAELAAHDVDKVVEEASTLERQKRREQITVQRADLQRCENHFNDASRSYKQVVDEMHSQPEKAKARSVAVVSSMVDQMGGANEETYVRLLSEKAGEKTSLHSINVSIISLLVGKSMAYGSEQLHELGIGALLHDLGKMELPDRLRWSDGELSSAERALYREHVAKGVALARRMGLSSEAQQIVAQHHEQADASGYPMKLMGEQISPAARIVSLVNRYDNLCNPGNPALAVTPHEALALIYAQRKDWFDPKVLNIFIRLMGVYPPGSIVELSDGRFAMVVSVNSSRPLRPRVIVHDRGIPAEEALMVKLENMPELGIRRSLKPVQLPKASHDYLSPRKRLCYYFERGREVQQNGTPA
jgi:putative nucleotidyltransferase with HDIG domain